MLFSSESPKNHAVSDDRTADNRKTIVDIHIEACFCSGQRCFYKVRLDPYNKYRGQKKRIVK